MSPLDKEERLSASRGPPAEPESGASERCLAASRLAGARNRRLTMAAQVEQRNGREMHPRCAHGASLAGHPHLNAGRS